MNNNLGAKLLKSNNFPVEKELNVVNLHKQVKSGVLNISLSSFEEIYNLTPKGLPFPIGAVNFEDGKRRFVISWVEEFSKLNITQVEEYTIRLRNNPTDSYPVLSLILGIHNGKIDPDSKEDLWYYKSTNLDLSLMLTRIKLYQLLNCDELLICLYNGSSEELDSFGFSLNRKELEEMMKEINSALSMLMNLDLTNHIRDFSSASKVVSSSFTNDGLPKSKEALTIYLKRKELEPAPTEHNWKEFLSI